MRKTRFFNLAIIFAMAFLCCTDSKYSVTSSTPVITEVNKSKIPNKEKAKKIVVEKKEIVVDEKGWTNVMDALSEIESGGDSTVVSKSGKYVGILQISPIVVKECNNILAEKGETKRFTLNDRKSVKKSREMFVLIQEKYNPEHNIEKGIRMWNGGNNYSKHSTQHYFNKATALLEAKKRNTI